jgi:hypothetical protein
VALHRAHPAPLLTTTVTGSSTIFTSTTARFSAWISVRRSSPYCLRVGLDLLDHSALQRRFAGAGCPRASSARRAVRQFLLDLDRLEPRQLAQADFEDVFGLAVADRPKASISAGLGSSLSRMMRITSSMFSRRSCRPSRMWMRASTLLSGARCARDVCARKSIHSTQDLAQALQRGPAVAADHHQVERRGGFEAGVREQRVDELLLVDRLGSSARTRDAPARPCPIRRAPASSTREHRRLQLQLLGAQAPSCRA